MPQGLSDDCRVGVSWGCPWGRLGSSRGWGVLPVCGHHIAGDGSPHLSWLEASEVAGLWGDSHHNRNVNTMVLIQPFMVRIPPSSGPESHACHQHPLQWGILSRILGYPREALGQHSLRARESLEDWSPLGGLGTFSLGFLPHCLLVPTSLLTHSLTLLSIPFSV